MFWILVPQLPLNKERLAKSDLLIKFPVNSLFTMLDILRSIASVCFKVALKLQLTRIFCQIKLNRNCRQIKSIAKEIDHFTWQWVLKNTQRNKTTAWKITRCKPLTSVPGLNRIKTSDVTQVARSWFDM